MLWWSVCLSTIDNGYHSQYSNNVIDTIKTINIETILGFQNISNTLKLKKPVKPINVMIGLIRSISYG